MQQSEQLVPSLLAVAVAIACSRPSIPARSRRGCSPFPPFESPSVAPRRRSDVLECALVALPRASRYGCPLRRNRGDLHFGRTEVTTAAVPPSHLFHIFSKPPLSRDRSRPVRAAGNLAAPTERTPNAIALTAAQLG